MQQREQQQLGLVKYNCGKAGMEGLDREAINRIIVEASRGSKFYENELRKEALLKQQIARKQEQVARLSAEQIAEGEAAADRELSKYEAAMRLDRTVVHIDMDAFYAAVEMRDHPQFRKLPMAVGSNSMLSTSNYVARRFGVRAAMPGFIARKLCPELIIQEPDFAKYTAIGRQVRAVLQEYSPLPIITMSLDEAYVDLTDHLLERLHQPETERTFYPRAAPKTPALVCKCQEKDQTTKKDEELDTCDACGLLLLSGKRVFGTSAEDAVREMRFRVFCATTLTCSAGIGPNSLLSKIASDFNKPNGQFAVQRDREAIARFVEALPIRKVPGIGHVSERRLNALGVVNCGDLRVHRGVLQQVCTRAAFAYYMRIACGHSDEADFEPDDGEAAAGALNRKSMSVERTFQSTADPTVQRQVVDKLCRALAADLTDEHIKGRTLTMKLKLDDFSMRSRAQSLTDYSDNFELINSCANDILREEARDYLARAKKPLALRLIGVRLSNLIHAERVAKSKQRNLESFFSSILPTPVNNSNNNKRPRPEPLDVRIAVTSESTACCSHDAAFQEDSLNKRSFRCPVCDRDIIAKDELEFNGHLDLCLNEPLLKKSCVDQEPPPRGKPAKPVKPLKASKSAKVGAMDKFVRRY